jgi:hypothetical protein
MGYDIPYAEEPYPARVKMAAPARRIDGIEGHPAFE